MPYDEHIYQTSTIEAPRTSQKVVEEEESQPNISVKDSLQAIVAHLKSTMCCMSKTNFEPHTKKLKVMVAKINDELQDKINDVQLQLALEQSFVEAKFQRSSYCIEHDGVSGNHTRKGASQCQDQHCFAG